jgi:glycosyltransferase involved in cell wall biosynthesis
VTAAPARRRVTVAVPYSVHPPTSGGQERVFFLWRGVADAFDVELVTLGDVGARTLEAEIAAGLREIRVPKTDRYRREQQRLAEVAGNAPVADVAPATLLAHAPEYAAVLARSVARADLVVAAQPFCMPALRACRGDLPLVYEAQNVEAHLKAALGPELGRVAREAEAEVCAAATFVLACSADDAAELSRLYGLDAARIHLAPNGVDTDAVAATDAAARAARRRAAGIDGTRIAMFVGSQHPPNVEAAEAIIGLAATMPDVTFLLAGRQCVALADRPRPRNVALMGTVDRATLATTVGVADVALNPMRTGSGSNVKIAGYLAAGVPIVTTPIGARGYDLIDGEHALVCELGDFAGRMRALLDDAALADRLARQGRRLAEARYDWQAIADGVVLALERVLAGVPRTGHRRSAGR